MHVVGTAGHVDHGKSTLVEELTGIDPDRWAEEKRRGLTIDLGFAWLTTPSGKQVGLIDVPGHERFIKNMLAGAGGISVCLFVVAANEGWMPQSAEHLAILDVLGIEHGVIAITKSDLVDEEALELAVAEAEERVKDTSLEGAAIVPCSAHDGTGIEDLVAALDAALDAAPPPPDLSRPRLWIDRVFTIGGAGTVVTGTLTGGHLHVGDAVSVSPGDRRARVRAIQSHKKQVEEIGPGNRVALNLVGLARDEAERGQAVLPPDGTPTTSHVDALVEVLPESVTGARHELESRGSHLFYSGSAETPVKISLIDSPAIGPGEKGFARLWLRDPLPLVRGDRFVLRDAGRILTFGGGRVLDPAPPSRRASKPGRVALLENLARATPERALVAILDEEGVVRRSDALHRSGAAQVTDHVVPLGDLLASPTAYGRLAESLLDELRAFHDRAPLESGMPREEARTLLGLDQGSFDDLVSLVEEVASDGSRVRLTTFGVSLDPAQARMREEIVGKIEGAGFSPPLRKELTADAALLRSLVESGDLVAIGDFYLTRNQAERAQEIVRNSIEEKGPATVAEIRDVLGTTRKYAVPLCEWLDASGVTRRQGDVRVLRSNG